MVYFAREKWKEMAILTAEKLSKSFGATDIFSNLSFQIADKAKIGLVGSNGVGKTTLLRILIGEDVEFKGTVHLAKSMRVGYLPQLSQFVSDKTLWAECLSVFDTLLGMQQQLRSMEKDLATNGQDENILAAYSKLATAFELAGGYLYETKIHQVLAGLGFSREDENRPWRQLSGGQRTRALLAKILLEDPDLLLLDEPTNHLDIDAVEWLEAYLKDWHGAVLLVSHDRYFLDQIAQSIWEMTPDLEPYKGNYSDYLQQREARYGRKLAEYEAQQAYVEKEEEYIRRNIAGQNTHQAQGRRKRLERMMSEARLIRPLSSISQRQMHIRLDPAHRSGNLVLKAENLQVGYQDEGKALFACPPLELLRKECAAIIGANGTGKTTFLKTILGLLPPLNGKVETGAQVKVGYFAQAHEDLHEEHTLLQEIEAAAPQMLPAQIRDYLARFLFVGDDVFKSVGLLSGGERGRLALAILGLQGANLLLLDEPTNHLDLPSQEILQSMLAGFDGTILLVSHDRYLIDALATQIWEVDSDHNRLIVFSGSYSQYKEYQQNERLQNEKIPLEQKEKNLIQIQSQVSTLSKNERMRVQLQLERVEKEISALEEEQKEVELQLRKPVSNANLIATLGERHREIQFLLAESLSEWEAIAQKLDV